MAKYSLTFVIASNGRYPQLVECLESIKVSWDRSRNKLSYEIYIGFAGLPPTNEIIGQIKGVGPMSCEYIKSASLSKIRNCGISNTTGEYLCFLDDDAEVAIDYFDSISEIIIDKRLEAFCGKILEKKTDRPLASCFKDGQKKSLGFNQFRYFMGSAHIVRRDAFGSIGLYDEEFGAGAKYGACEESDLFFRILRAGGRIFYFPRLTIIHPPLSAMSDEKIFSYNYGNGALLAKHLYLLKKRPLDYLFVFVYPLFRVSLIFIINSILRLHIDKRRQMIINGNLRGFTDYLSRKVAKNEDRN